jgi:hemerythrin-like domain-containing protein
MARMDNTPDLTFYFAIHQAQRDALDRYVQAVSTLRADERAARGKALARWAKGFTAELDEHHHVEDAFFFPSLLRRVPSVDATIARLADDHGHLDELLARWPAVAAAIADQRAPFADAQRDAVAFATDLRDFLTVHLAVEDEDILPLFWRHYSADEYDTVLEQAVKHGKKRGMWFVAPFSVDCYPEGPERDAFMAAAPAALRLLHRLVRPRYDRLVAAALGPTPARV